MSKKPSHIIPEKVIGTKSEPYVNSFTEDQAILYALGIGFNQGNITCLFRSFKIRRFQIHLLIKLAIHS